MREKALYWIQRGKIRTAIEGDENSRFFHASASARLRKNKINVLLHNESEFFSHHDKSSILLDFYAALLGTPFQPSWTFDLTNLYPSPIPQLRHLVDPFTDDEIATAFFAMNQNASPGPDGFGPGFYRKFWHIIKGKIKDFFLEFHSLGSDISCLNRALIILLPKSNDARSPSDFRPISLQNCPIKGLAKLLTLRLKPLIPLLVHADQTGFLSGRNISENFLYAADILHCCAKRKAPTLVVKLDFKKAFDLVCWASLLHTLRIRGFPQLWSDWINALLGTGSTAVMLNGIPGRWISVKMGSVKGTLCLHIFSSSLQTFCNK